MFKLLETTVKVYEGTPSSPSCPQFKAWLMASQALKLFVDEVVPDLVKASEGEQEGVGDDGGSKSSGGGSGKRKGPKGKKNSSKKGAKGSKKGKKK